MIKANIIKTIKSNNWYKRDKNIKNNIRKNNYYKNLFKINFKNKKKAMDLKKVLNFNNHQADESNSCFPSLSWNQRLLGFIVCFVIGYFIQLMSFGSFVGVVAGSPAKFAILYTAGNIISLIGTGFLTGFVQQLKNMADQERRLTSIIFISSMAGCIIFSIFIQIKFLVFLCVIIQIPSYIWYCATYIPFARDCIKTVLGGCWEGIRNRFRR